MNIVVFTRYHISSNLILKELIKKYGKKIVLIVDSDVLIPKRNYLQGLIFYLRKSGFYYVCVQVIRQILFFLLSFYHTEVIKNRKSGFYSFIRTCDLYKIPVEKVSDINNPVFVDRLKKIKPDLVVSIMFNQIIGKKVLDIPKYGVINFHPAPLPYYKGVSPIFWALVNGEKEHGTTVHYIDEGIDTGGIIATRKIDVNLEDTENSLYLRACEESTPMITGVISKIIREGRILPSSKKRGGSYYSFPNKDSVAKFVKNGRRFFSFKEYFGK